MLWLRLPLIPVVVCVGVVVPVTTVFVGMMRIAVPFLRFRVSCMLFMCVVGVGVVLIDMVFSIMMLV